MARHTRPLEPAAGRRRGAGGRWTRRRLRGVPLLPTVAAAFAAVVVITAITSSQVSLTFANNPPPGQGPCTGAGCEGEPYTAPEPGEQSMRPAARHRGASTKPARPGRPAPSTASRSPAHQRGGTIGAAESGSTTAGSAAAAPPAPMSVAFRRAEKWNGGYVSTATITNRGQRPVPAWTLAFTVDGGSVIYAWEVDVVRTGKHVAVRSRPGDPAIAPGQSLEVGFAGDGTYHPPRDCRINGQAC